MTSAHETLTPTTAAAGSRPSLVVGAMVILATLDLVGAALARHWAIHRAAPAMVLGLGVFAVLFVVYAQSLAYAELTTVTIGWIVLVQVGVVVLQRLDGVAIPAPKLAAIAGILALQAFLTLSDLSRG
jgi:hypothetical protein